MPGGYKNIKASDNPSPFEANNTIALKWTEAEALKLGNDLLAWMKAEDENIFFEDWLYLVADENKYAGKIYADLPKYLSDKYSTFFELMKQCAKIEEVKLKKFSAFDKLNSTIAKFLLTCNYGYTDKINIDHTTKDEAINREIEIKFVKYNNGDST
jgi:hypothetical protein